MLMFFWNWKPSEIRGHLIWLAYSNFAERWRKTFLPNSCGARMSSGGGQERTPAKVWPPKIQPVCSLPSLRQCKLSWVRGLKDILLRCGLHTTKETKHVKFQTSRVTRKWWLAPQSWNGCMLCECEQGLTRSLPTYLWCRGWCFCQHSASMPRACARYMGAL